MGRITAQERRAQIELIAKKLSQGYTDTDCINELKIKRARFYVYKAKIFAIWGDIAQKKSSESVAFEADVLKDRLLRLQRMLELQLHESKDHTLSEFAEACSVAAQLSIAIFKLEFEGFKMKDLRGSRELERQTISSRLLNSGNVQRDIPESDLTTESEESDEPTDGSPGESQEKVY